MAAVVTTSPTSEKIGFGSRAVALIIDTILLVIVQAILGALTGNGPGSSTGLSFVVGLAYYLYFWSSYGGGQTVGMKAMKIRVIKTDGSQLALVGALVRYIGFIIACIPIFLGLIWVLFDANKQGWHDKIANTYVVKA